jgi:hypothetical protein
MKRSVSVSSVGAAPTELYSSDQFGFGSKVALVPAT